MVVSRTYKLSTPEINEECSRLKQTLDHMSIISSGLWTVNLLVFNHKNSQALSKDLFLISSAESSIGVVSTADQRYSVIETAPGLDMLIESIETYRLRRKLVIEGSEYRLGDFTIRFGVENSTEIKSLLLQIEFSLPLYLSQGVPAITELKNLLDPMDVFLLKTIQYEEKVDINGELFSPKHTAVDLLIALNCIS